MLRMFVLLLLLTACSQTAPSGPTSKVPSNAAAFASVPVATPIDIATSVNLFADICGGTFPSTSLAKAAQKARGFNPDLGTGTFYDGRRNVSFSLQPQHGKASCSMVFASNGAPGQLARAMASANLKGPKSAIKIDPSVNSASAPSGGNATMLFSPKGTIGSATYYRALKVAS